MTPIDIFSLDDDQKGEDKIWIYKVNRLCVCVCVVLGSKYLLLTEVVGEKCHLFFFLFIQGVISLATWRHTTLTDCLAYPVSKTGHKNFFCVQMG